MNARNCSARKMRSKFKKYGGFLPHNYFYSQTQMHSELYNPSTEKKVYDFNWVTGCNSLSEIKH